MIYLASPYSDPDPAVRQLRFEQVTLVAGKLLAQGQHVFAPITYGHPIAELGGGPTDAAAWQEFNYHMFSLADEVILLALEGFKNSVGVALELEWAAHADLTVQVITLRDFGL